MTKVLKTKTEIKYSFIKKSGKYEQVLITKYIYRYDDNGNHIEDDWYDADGKLKLKYLFKYDDRGNRIERVQYDADGKLIGKLLPKYDDRGNQIEKASYDADDKLEWKNPYKYKYDDNGNMTEQVEYVIREGKEVMQYQTVWEYEFYP